MRIVLDLQSLQSQSRGRGIGSYSRGLASALLSLQEGHEWHVLLNAAVAGGDPMLRDTALVDWLRDRVDPRHIHVFSGLYSTQGAAPGFEPRENASSLIREQLLAALRPDIVHVASPFEGFGDEAVVEAVDLTAGSGTPWLRAATLYDLIPFDMPDEYLAEPKTRAFFEKRFGQLAANDGLLAISNHVAAHAAAKLGRDTASIAAIGADVDSAFRPVPMNPADRAGLLARYGIRRPFFMHVGILEHRKNVGFLAQAFAALPAEIRAQTQVVLIAQNNAFHRQRCAEWRAAYGLSEDELVLAGAASHEDLIRLYGQALAAIMPSMAEGFGLPLLEAMRCGTPGFGARTTSLPEVVGDDAYLFDLDQPDQLARLMLQMAGDTSFQARAREHATAQAQQFSWERSARLAMAAFERWHGESGGRAARMTAPVRLPGRLAVSRVIDTGHLRVLDQGPRQLAFDTAGAVTLTPEASALLRYREGGYRAMKQAEAAGESASLVLEAPAGTDAKRVLALHPHAWAVMGPTPDGGWHWAHRPQVSAEPLDAVLQDRAASRDAAETALAASLAAKGLADDLVRVDRMAAIAGALAPGEIGHIARSLVLDRAKDPGAAPQGQRRLLVDVSHLARYDAKSGIQRVVRNILTGLFAQDLPYRVEPVYRLGNDIFFARHFTTRFLKIPTLPLRDDLVDFRPDDIFLGLDLDADIPPDAIARMEEIKRIGVTFIVVVYDILPLRHPQWFDPGMGRAFQGWIEFLSRCADMLACISQATADDVAAALAERGCPRLAEIQIAPFPLGADILSDPNAAEQGGGRDLRAELGVEQILITVGTIEPRKGHDHLLDAIESLLARRSDVGFAIVGKRGWLVDDLIARLQGLASRYPQVKWVEGANDRELATLYQQASAAIVPSRAEGFGLPLIEAEHSGKPVLARDIPVFREIGSATTQYFRSADGPGLAAEIETFLETLSRQPQTNPEPARRWLWSESTRVLLELVARSLKP